MIADPKSIENVAEIVTREILNALVAEESSQMTTSSGRAVQGGVRG